MPEAEYDLTYYTYERDFPVREYLPKPVGAVLDIGCGGGGMNRPLRDAGATRIVGIEVVESVAKVAAQRYDRVLVGSAEREIADLKEVFDTILCYDVLEHLVDPWHVLRVARGLVAPGGHIHVSLPNARYLGLVRDLVFKDTFGYSETGHRDRTHLRWFTKKDLERALCDTGWRPIGAGHMPLGGKRGRLNALAKGQLTGFLVEQWMILGEASESPKLPSEVLSAKKVASDE